MAHPRSGCAMPPRRGGIALVTWSMSAAADSLKCAAGQDADCNVDEIENESLPSTFVKDASSEMRIYIQGPKKGRRGINISFSYF